MKNIPTAESFFLSYQDRYPGLKDFISTNSAQGAQTTIDIMVEFAKLHVQAALQAALEEVPYGSSTDTVSYEDVSGILTCYPLENIK